MATDQKLKWILTEYGKRRINELLTNPDDKVRISFMNVGDDNTGVPSDREGVTPALGDGNLFHQVNPTRIPIFEKGISNTRENTVYFKALIDENMCGFDISELALYEEINGQEKMFAVGVGQPIAKPKLSDGYLMSIEYTLYIESTNLLDVYDKIELDPDNEFLKETDFQALYKTVLYVEGNLAEQIGRNSHLIGLGRAQELNELINKTQLQYHSSAMASFYANMCNAFDVKNLAGFWSFYYTNNYSISSNIKDFSSYGNNISTDVLTSYYTQDYLGLLSSLNIDGEHFFNIPAAIGSVADSDDIEIGHLLTHDSQYKGKYVYSSSGVWYKDMVAYDEMFMQNHIIKYYLPASNVQVVYMNSDGKLITEDGKLITDQSRTAEVIKHSDLELEINEKDETKVQKKLGIKCYGPHTWTYNSESQTWNSDHYKSYDIEKFKIEIAPYKGTPNNGDQIRTLLNLSSVINSQTITSATPNVLAEPYVLWTCKREETGGARWVSNLSITERNENYIKQNVADYEGSATDGDTIYIKPKAPKANENIYVTGNSFDLLAYTPSTIGADKVQDSPFTFISVLKHNNTGTNCTLFAQSNDFSNKHNFEIIKTDKNAIVLRLYTSEASNREIKYIEFKSPDYSVPEGIYNVIIVYDPKYDSRNKLNPSATIYINSTPCNVTKTDKGYTGMRENIMDTTSYISRLVDNKNIKADNIDAQICLISLIKQSIDEDDVRRISLMLNSLGGRNIYFKV